MGTARRLFLLCLRIGAAGCAGILLAELFLRWLAPQPLLTVDPGLYEADPPGQYRLAAGYHGTVSNAVEYSTEVVIESDGFRSTGRSGQRAPAADRPLLATIGDSFTFGQGVEDDETFTALLPERLGERLRVVNAGLPGIGVPRAVVRYERHVRPLRPDIVLLAVFLGNDLSDARPDREPIAIVDGLIAPAATPRGLRHVLYDHSHLVRALGRAGAHTLVASLRRSLGLGEPFLIRTLRYEMSNYAVEPSEPLRQALDSTDEAIGRLVASCQSDGTVLVAALLPDRLQLADAAWRSALSMLRLDPAAYDRRLPQQRFARLLDEHGVAFLDLTPAFSKALARGETLYYRLDRHWTPQGHRLAADELARFLAERALPILERRSSPGAPTRD